MATKMLRAGCKLHCIATYLSLTIMIILLCSYIAAQIHEHKTLLGNRSKACYYLMRVSPEKMLGYDCKIAILEPEETPSELISKLSGKGKIVLAYLNAGYAESWREYWTNISREEWVHEPSGYEGEYFIEYWRPEWRNILVRLADQYIREGFDGIYLDNIDVAETIALEEPSWSKNINPWSEIVNLVCSIKRELASLKPKSLLFINIGGAVKLLYNQTLLSCIDGVLREELWTRIIGDNTTEKQACSETLEALNALVYARSKGKTILVADPITSKLKAEAFCKKAWSYGFIPIPQPAWLYDYSSPPPSNWCKTKP